MSSLCSLCPCRACQTARLDALVSACSTRRTSRDVTWRLKWNLGYSVGVTTPAGHCSGKSSQSPGPLLTNSVRRGAKLYSFTRCLIRCVCVCVFSSTAAASFGLLQSRRSTVITHFATGRWSPISVSCRPLPHASSSHVPSSARHDSTSPGDGTSASATPSSADGGTAPRRSVSTWYVLRFLYPFCVAALCSYILLTYL